MKSIRTTSAKATAVSLPIKQLIHVVWGQRVNIDADLAALCGVTTKAMLQAFQRNISRFPGDFMLRFSDAELKNWRSQFVTSNPAAKRGLKRPHWPEVRTVTAPSPFGKRRIGYIVDDD
jgi:hypothetical protein